MQNEIGPTLREARIRRKIDLTEIEERTKIRVRYLRALETEEWDVLPGPTYTRSFIRTYANYLGLDGERLADDFRRFQESQALEGPGGREPPVIAAGLPHTEGRRRFGPGSVAAVAVVGLVVALLVLGVVLGGSEEPSPPAPQPSGGTPAKGSGERQQERQPQGVSIRLAATADVWVCAVAANGTPVVDGLILTGGAEEGPFRSGRFDLAFGNGSIDLLVDGRPFDVEDTPSPVGYRVTAGGVSELAEGTRPDCT